MRSRTTESDTVVGQASLFTTAMVDENIDYNIACEAKCVSEVRQAIELAKPLQPSECPGLVDGEGT